MARLTGYPTRDLTWMCFGISNTKQCADLEVYTNVSDGVFGDEARGYSRRLDDLKCFECHFRCLPHSVLAEPTLFEPAEFVGDRTHHSRNSG